MEVEVDTAEQADGGEIVEVESEVEWNHRWWRSWRWVGWTWDWWSRLAKAEA